MPAGNFSLIDLSGLARPAEVLVQKVCDAVGIVYEPTKIRNNAKAEADANKIIAAANIEIGEMEERAIQRLIASETKKQENIEAITFKAIEHLDDRSDPSRIDNDWMVNFFNKCGSVSNEEMQSLWAKLLAGEANKTGSFAKRTVELVSLLEKSEADIFSQFCCYILTDSDSALVPIVRNYDDPIYSRDGINFSGLQTLSDIGLIVFEPLIGFRMTELKKDVEFSYFGTRVAFSLPDNSANELQLGQVLLTRTGTELAPISGANQIDNFLPYLKIEYAKSSVEVTF